MGLVLVTSFSSPFIFKMYEELKKRLIEYIEEEHRKDYDPGLSYGVNEDRFVMVRTAETIRKLETMLKETKLNAQRNRQKHRPVLSL